MKQKIKLPTVLGLLVLVVGLVAGIFLINQSQVFRIGANVDAAPKNVRITNVNDTSFSVTWTTDIESVGFIKSGTSRTSLSNVSNEEQTKKSYVHSVSVVGIEPNSDIYFGINSNGKDYDNNGIPWQAKTTSFSINSKSNLLASGSVLSVDGSKPSKAIVYTTVNGKVLSNITSDEGSYIIPISSFVEAISDTTVIEISVIDGQGSSSQALVYPAVVKSIPTIILGKTYDFRSLSPTEDNRSPQSSLSIPEQVEASSRFEVTKSQPTETGDVTIDSIDNGEIINTTDPEFFGTAPRNSTIEIQVESELQTGIVNVGANGRWSWSPPANLEPGEHKLTVKMKDASGILRTITRSFVVLGAEGPAFESTPSGSLAPTPSITPTSTPVNSPVATIIATNTPNATLEPTPETGSLTPTLGLFIMGIGVLMSSFFVYKKIDA